MGDSPNFSKLVEIMGRLRGPDGCPWDREQTLDTLKAFLLEETYEVLEALEEGDPADLREELGDLLLEVVFLAQICSEQGHFDIEEVAGAICDKLVRRHPHVFGDNKAGDAREAIRRWEDIKNQERVDADRKDRSRLAGVPRQLPALLRAQRLSSKAGMAGFDWPRMEDLYSKLEEEYREFREAAGAEDREGMKEELGDLLFIVANIGRHAEIDPEDALQAANRKFTSRFRHIERELSARGIGMEDATLDQMEEIWEEAKKAEGKRREDGPDGCEG